MADLADLANDIAQNSIDRIINKAPRFNKPSETICIDCEDPIPIQRQNIGGVKRCVDCQTYIENRL